MRDILESVPIHQSSRYKWWIRCNINILVPFPIQESTWGENNQMYSFSHFTSREYSHIPIFLFSWKTSHSFPHHEGKKRDKQNLLSIRSFHLFLSRFKYCPIRLLVGVFSKAKIIISMVHDYYSCMDPQKSWS